MTPDDRAWMATTPRPIGADSAASGGLRSVGHALDVLECFAADTELGVSDVARRLQLAKSTTHRLLQTLCSRGFVEQDPETGLYRLGIHIYELGHLAQSRNKLRHVALPLMRELARRTGQTVNLGVCDGVDVVFIERIETGSGREVLNHVGRRLPLHTTSSGKVIAAFNPDAAAARARAGFPPRAKNTVRNANDWDRALQQVRRDGFAVSHDESFNQVSSLAVPILVRGRAIAAISAFGISATIVPEFDRIRLALVDAALRVARAIERER